MKMNLTEISGDEGDGVDERRMKIFWDDRNMRIIVFTRASQHSRKYAYY